MKSITISPVRHGGRGTPGCQGEKGKGKREKLLGNGRQCRDVAMAIGEIFFFFFSISLSQ